MSPSTDRLLKVSPPADSESKEMAEKLARFVAESGPEVEAMTVEHNRDNPSFRSVAAHFYFSLTLALSRSPPVATAVSYTTTTVRPTASTKRGCRSIAPLRPRAPQPQPRPQQHRHCSRQHRRLRTTPPCPAVRTQNLCLSNERGRAGGGLKMTRSTCPCLPLSFPRR